MATSKKNRIVVADEQPDYDDDFAQGDDVAADHEYAENAANCLVCGELLAWHEQACAAALAAPAAEAQTVSEPEVPLQPAPTGFAYAIGGRVQPPFGADAHATITWRGQLKERQPGSGLVRRVNVYRLDNGYWDCYHEEELQVA